MFIFAPFNMVTSSDRLGIIQIQALISPAFERGVQGARVYKAIGKMVNNDCENVGSMEDSIL